MELEGRNELVDTGKSRKSWSVPTVPLRLAVLNVLQGFFGPKNGCFWAGEALQFLKSKSATCESRSRPPPLRFSLKLCVIELHTHRYHLPNFHPNLKHHDGNLISTQPARAARPPAARPPAAAAKLGRSSPDTQKAYKTNIGSTSLVTLTLALTQRDRKGR